MQKRTFFRIMFDSLFVNNAFSKAIFALVNFCNEQSYYNKKELKFLKKMPINKIETTSDYKTRFIFNTPPSSGANYK